MKTALFFMHLIQDLDLLYPLLAEAGKREDLKAVVYLTDRLYRSYPRVRQALQALGINYRVIPYPAAFFGLVRNLKGFSALVTAAESNARAHRVAHVMTQQANRQGLRTYTLQHGFEQPGLTYFRDAAPASDLQFASKNIFLWGNLSELPERVAPDIRARCLPVGCPKAFLAAGETALVLEKHGPVISVFENLHWERYDENYRNQFVRDLFQTMETFPQATFLVRPHPNNRWLARKRKKDFLNRANLIFADPADPFWGMYSASALIRASDAVITTPSTVALDAAQAGKPAAVTSYGLPLERYQPLPLIYFERDWTDFIEQATSEKAKQNLQERSREFSRRHLLPGSAATRILETVLAGIERSR